MDDEVERVADHAAARRYNDAMRKRRSRAAAGIPSKGRPYQPRSTHTTTPREIRLRYDQWAQIRGAADRAGLNISGWFSQLVDDVFGLRAETDDWS